MALWYIPSDGYYIFCSIRQILQQAANLGGDSDTIGAIAGGLAGIYYGYEGIPARYVESILIKDRFDRVISQLYVLKTS
nr:ADP-ribosylglycohydrolase family protein [Paenibacillus peoriae]